ncbi:MAG: hypothetical protein ACLS9P_01275 [Haemophilus parainfluenzae]
MKNNSVVADIVANQRKLERKRWFVILSFLAIGVVSLILDVMTGPAMPSVFGCERLIRHYEVDEDKQYCA